MILLFGKAFIGAYEPLVILMVIPFLGIFSFPLTPMLYALDRPDAPFQSRLFGTILYFAVVAPLSWQFRVTGAAAAFVIGNAAMAAALAIQVAVEYRRIRKR